MASRWASPVGRCGWIAIFLATSWVTLPAHAVPAFARATGVPCATCHTIAFGPALTAFGRNFKLHGYTLKTRKSVPVSLDVITSFTHTSADQPPPPRFGANDNLALDDLDLYLVGRITPHVGAFAQVSYDGIARHTAWGVLDVRWARDFTLHGHDVLLGASVNNFPTVQDPWNSTYAWRFPFPALRLANQPAAFLQINGAFATQSLGGTVYALAGETFYLEAGGYRQLAARLQGDLGVPNAGAEHGIDGTAPYWRAAVQRSWGPHYFSAGLVGLVAHAQTPQERPFGSDHYEDRGVDATYQFASGGPHSFNVYGSYTREEQRLFGAGPVGAAQQIANHLQELSLSAQYVFRQSWSGQLGFFDVGGSRNAALFAPGPLYGSRNGRPDSRGYTLQLEAVPFGKADSRAHPFLNLRVGLQYTGYMRFNGGDGNYDGFGHRAHDNDTLFLFLWMAI